MIILGIWGVPLAVMLALVESIELPDGRQHRGPDSDADTRQDTGPLSRRPQTGGSPMKDRSSPSARRIQYPLQLLHVLRCRPQTSSSGVSMTKFPSLKSLLEKRALNPLSPMLPFPMCQCLSSPLPSSNFASFRWTRPQTLLAYVLLYLAGELRHPLLCPDVIARGEGVAGVKAEPDPL